jgi:hypothetical protein
MYFFSFAWLYMDSMDMLFRGPGDHFYSYQAFVLHCGPYLSPLFCNQKGFILVCSSPFISFMAERWFLFYLRDQILH